MTAIEQIEQQQLGRAKNATLTFLERRLSVPKIYIDAEWAGKHVDVLAIDRDGVGDVTVVLFFVRKRTQISNVNIAHEESERNRLSQQLDQIPAQFKYLAAVDVITRDPAGLGNYVLANLDADKLLAPDGLGRTGVIQVLVPTEGDTQVTLAVKPERFRAKIAKLADDYILTHEADWEIRA